MTSPAEETSFALADTSLRPGSLSPFDMAGGDPVAQLRGLLERAKAAVATAERRLAEQNQRIVELEALSLTDELTGLFNRRGFDCMFGRTLKASQRDGHEGVVLYIDLDGFKAINDTYGHHAGDAVLSRVGHVLTEHVRADDVVARLGGDEFAVLLTRTRTEDAQPRITALENLLARLPVRVGSGELTVHASIGAAPYRSGESADAVLARADRAMYRIKRVRQAAPPQTAGLRVVPRVAAPVAPRPETRPVPTVRAPGAGPRNLPRG